jgi:hypothetical protein
MILKQFTRNQNNFSCACSQQDEIKRKYFIFRARRSLRVNVSLCAGLNVPVGAAG